MSEGLSTLEKFVIRLGIIPVSLIIAGSIAYGLCIGEAVIKGTYRKIRGDPRSFRELYKENFLGEEK